MKGTRIVGDERTVGGEEEKKKQWGELKGVKYKVKEWNVDLELTQKKI